MLSPEPEERPSAALLSMTFTPSSCCLNWANEKATFPGPDEELYAAEMICAKDGIDCCPQVHLSDSIANKPSQDAFASAIRWLEECSHWHEACRPSAMSHTKPLPTRLVDIRPDGEEGSYIRVVDSDTIKSSQYQTEYIALSHARIRRFVALHTHFVEKMQEDFLREALPKEYELAIQAAQRLGYRYIWDDSLCIIQDSEDDRRKECANMASVFRNAALTIVLDQLGKENLGHVDHNEINLDMLANPLASAMQEKPNTQAQALAPVFLPAIDFITPGFAWDTQAWVLQDRLLSRRLLHLGSEQMYWECNSLKASETFPRGLPSLVWEKVHSKPSSHAVRTISVPVPSKNIRDSSHGDSYRRISERMPKHDGNPNPQTVNSTINSHPKHKPVYTRSRTRNDKPVSTFNRPHNDKPVCCTCNRPQSDKPVCTSTRPRNEKPVCTCSRPHNETHNAGPRTGPTIISDNEDLQRENQHKLDQRKTSFCRGNVRDGKLRLTTTS